MTAFTRLGSALWDWEPWTELSAGARLLWLALYTSAEAKRHVPGLWQGGIPAMADAARMAPDEVIGSLDRLLERDMVEYDAKLRVLRLCELPDAGEYPNNGKVIRSWWTKFRTVPQCLVRDAHVRTIHWILDTGSKRLHHADGGGPQVTANHQEAWATTFGTISVPPPRRRGVRRLADSDTSTQLQPSLFPIHADSVPSAAVVTTSSDAGYPQRAVNTVDNSASVRQSNEIRVPDTVSDTVSDTNRISDPGSRIPDLLSLSGEGGRGGGHETGMAIGSRPALALVPPFSAAAVLAELALGNWDPTFDRSHQDALSAMIPRWAGDGVVLADFSVLAEYNAHAGRRQNLRLLLGCDLGAEISTARRTIDWRNARMATVAP